MATTTRILPFDQPDPLAPPPAYAELRAAEPVARVHTRDGRQAWLVTSYDAVSTVLSDPRFGVTPPGGDGEADGSLLQDGEAHARLRRLVGKAFTGRSVAALRPRIERLAADHAGSMAAAGPPADLVATFAAPLSIDVISELFGVAIDERAHFRRLADAASAADPFDLDMDEATAAATQRAWYALSGYVAGLIAAKRADLGEDLLSALIAVRDADDGRLSGDELVIMATTIVASGYLTATNAIAVGVLQLVSEGRFAALADEPGEAGAAVEEVVRRLAGLTGEPFPRYAREDVELAGVSIAAGDLVLVRLGAANRDPAHFTEPDRFLPDRVSGPHLAFGRGPHYCLGAALARVEVGAALRALARRLPGLRLHVPVDDLVWIRSHADTGPTAVPVAW
ncbi:MAG: cytochrome P450 [Streptosporangiales bacterium]|nr:cytochrome P450 [Streptosporangiales bacterium]